MSASHATSGNSGHDVNVEVDVTKTASSEKLKWTYVKSYIFRSDRWEGRPICPSLRLDARNEPAIQTYTPESEVEFGMNYK